MSISVELFIVSSCWARRNFIPIQTNHFGTGNQYKKNTGQRDENETIQKYIFFFQFNRNGISSLSLSPTTRHTNTFREMRRKITEIFFFNFIETRCSFDLSISNQSFCICSLVERECTNLSITYTHTMVGSMQVKLLDAVDGQRRWNAQFHSLYALRDMIVLIFISSWVHPI